MSGSRARTLAAIDWRTPLNATEPASPNSTPIADTEIPCRMTIARTRPARAPNAMRTPVSCRRCVTAKARTP